MSICKRFTLARNCLPLQPMLTLVGAPQNASSPPTYIAQPSECWLELTSCNFNQLLISAQVLDSTVTATRHLKVFSSLTADVEFDETTGTPLGAEELLSVEFDEHTPKSEDDTTVTVNSDRLGQFLFWVVDLQKVASPQAGMPREEYACFEVNVTVS